MMEFNLQRFAEDAGGDAAADAGAGSTSLLGDAGGGNVAEDEGGMQETSANAQENTANAEKTTENAQAEGVPETYDFRDAVPEGMEYDEASAKAFGSLAKECGLTQAQASKLAAYGMEYMRNGVGAFAQAQAMQRAQWAQDAKTSLAGDFDSTIARAGTALDLLDPKGGHGAVIPGLRQALDETGAGNRIEIIQAMARLGDLVGEDHGHGVTGAPAKDAPIYGNTNFALY